MNEFFEIWKEVLMQYKTILLFAFAFGMTASFIRCSCNIIRGNVPYRSDKKLSDLPKLEKQKNVVVGHIMTDDEKIQYIIDNVHDIECASDQIADIYYKQMTRGDKV